MYSTPSTAAGTTTANVFKFYDFATNTWSAAETGATDGIAPAAVIGTDSKLIATPSWQGTDYWAFATGTATAGAATTLTNSAKSWTVNQWTNYQVRIVSGTGAGQIRTIASNTATALTVSAAWTTNPDATSAYSIEGNDDFIYYMGSNAVTLYRYSISAGTWTTLAPGAARAAAPGIGMSGHWAWESSDAAWTSESAIISGLAHLLVPWWRQCGARLLTTSPPTPGSVVSPTPRRRRRTRRGPSTSTRTTVSMCRRMRRDAGSGATSSPASRTGWSTMTYTQGAAVLGDTAFDVHYTDAATQIDYMYMILNTSNVMLRAMVI